jgi:DNA-binding winged helix-turn-helix (wHTH) protein
VYDEPVRLRFEDCELDPTEARFVRAGKVIELQPKHLEALVFFASRPGRLVTHAELMEGLWPDAHVNEEALQQVVSKLRKALGDAARDPRFLQTIPKRGYRFLPTVEILPEPAPVPVPTPAPQPAPVPTPAPVFSPQPVPVPVPVPAPIAVSSTLASPAPTPVPTPTPAPVPSRRSTRPLRIALTIVSSALAIVAVAAARRPSSSPSLLAPRPGATRSLTHSLERKQEGTFSPDGRTVIFAANDPEEGQYDLYLIALAEGSERLRLTHTPADEFYPQVAPDGAAILFSRADGTWPAAFLMPVTGGAARQVAPRAAFATQEAQMLATGPVVVARGGAGPLGSAPLQDLHDLPRVRPAAALTDDITRLRGVATSPPRAATP